MMRAAARSLSAYVKKGVDDRYHILPSVSSENWGFTVDFRLNKDCILDLALTRLLLNAMVEASSILKIDADERAQWSEIRDKLAPYPSANGPYGEVWLDIGGAPVEHVYNVPITLAPVFPGEQVGLGNGDEHLEIARRTARTIRLEGGNDLVSQSLIRARLGILDLKWFKSQVEYGMLPDGVSNDRVRQSGGRYGVFTDFDFMMRMGLWCENFAVPAVLNECMLQSYRSDSAVPECRKPRTRAIRESTSGRSLSYQCFSRWEPLCDSTPLAKEERRSDSRPHGTAETSRSFE